MLSCEHGRPSKISKCSYICQLLRFTSRSSVMVTSMSIQRCLGNSPEAYSETPLPTPLSTCPPTRNDRMLELSRVSTPKYKLLPRTVSTIVKEKLAKACSCPLPKELLSRGSPLPAIPVDPGNLKVEDELGEYFGWLVNHFHLAT